MYVVGGQVIQVSSEDQETWFKHLTEFKQVVDLSHESLPAHRRINIPVLRRDYLQTALSKAREESSMQILLQVLMKECTLYLKTLTLSNTWSY